MLNVFALIMIVVGIALLTASLRPVNHIYQTDKNRGWRVLRGLVLFFIVGYLGVFYYLCQQEISNNVDLIVSLIMMAGGFFVFLVTRLSLRSMVKLEVLAKAERKNSLHDNLTGLPNRKYLMESLQTFVDKEQAFSLLLLDLNRFKQINDALGHYYGDLLLIEIGKRVGSALCDDAQLFRLGGDEFALTLINSDATKIKRIVEVVHHCFDEIFEIENYELSVSASIGATHFPEDGRDIGTLLQQSDLAMYDSKKTSSLFTEYDKSLQSGAAEKVNIATLLKEAIELEQFELWYQPIIDLKTGAIHGAEALLRWPRPDGSFIPPDKFIKIAEQSALITRITDWVMYKVSQDLAYFKSQGLDLCIHVNISVKDLQDILIVPKVRKIIEKHAIQANQLMLEITESAMMTDIAQVKSSMEQISEVGLVFSVDDFGTGYSSLALLRDLPVGQIKIDRSFIQNMASNSADLAIVKSTLFLAQNLGCNVVAEGVEDKETALMLKDLGCDFVQGFYYCRPQNIHDTVNYLFQQRKN